MGKTAIARAAALWLHEHRDQLEADVVLYSVKPNQTKSMWHGEDARIIREELWGPIRQRQAQQRERTLIQLVVFDEIDSLGKRPGAGQHVYSAAQSDALESLLVEMDGLVPVQASEGPSGHVLCIGLTNRLDRVDEAMKRPGRFDTVLQMPESDLQAAEDVMEVYARGACLPWYFEGQVQQGLDQQTIRRHFLRPALAHVYRTVVLYYQDDAQRRTDVTAGQLLSNAHYMDALKRARKRAGLRAALGSGLPAVSDDDVVDCLMLVANKLATQMAADPDMLIRQLGIRIPVTEVHAVAPEENQQYRHLRVHSA
jgi:SpoVK/Ycf46/Vps4 family AAA+-type ATPase